jgi:UDP-N-acetyl-D-galactosamine dehydrogenase
MPIVAVVGLGYVGLPLAVAFGRNTTVIGLDLSEEKVSNYGRFCDPSGELSASDLKSATGFRATCDPTQLSTADFIIVAVPTPVDTANLPDWRFFQLLVRRAGR